MGKNVYNKPPARTDGMKDMESSRHRMRGISSQELPIPIVGKRMGQGLGGSLKPMQQGTNNGIKRMEEGTAIVCVVFRWLLMGVYPLRVDRYL